MTIRRDLTDSAIIPSCITIFFNSGHHDSCRFDRLYVGNSDNGKYHCGSNLPEALLVDGRRGAAVMKFHSDGSLIRRGFSVRIVKEKGRKLITFIFLNPI